MLGAGRDIYAVNLKKTSGTGPIIAVKAPGFVLDGVGLVGNGAVNGEGATIAGLELFGDSNGNIDALIRGASFQYLSVGVHVRARNATIQENLFSNCLNGLVVDGTDAVYHTGLDADQNRGNTIRGNRFHNIGATRLNAGIQITSSARVLHALIDSNYFDSNGVGRHIVATGTAVNPHSKITIRGNKHTELGANGYDLTYVNNSTISGSDLAGNAVGGYSGHGVVLSHCDTVTVGTVFGLQLGGSGIVARDCTKLNIHDVKFRSVGLDPNAVGNGIDIDSSNTLVDLARLSVEAADGWGFIGNPASASMVDCDFIACALGRMQSTTTLNRASKGLNTFVEGQFGNLESTGRQSYDFVAATAKRIAIVTVGSSYGSFLLDVEFTARDGVSGNCYVVVRRIIRPENGAPVVTRIGSDSLANCQITIVPSGKNGVAVSLTPAAKVFGSVLVRASAGGAANGTNLRGVTVAMA